MQPPSLPPCAAPAAVQSPDGLAEAILACRRCATAPVGAPLPVPPRPIFVLSATARLVIASQAPGFRAFTTGIPFQDPSGERLRDWMCLAPAQFYDPGRVMILPMGFCFPGHDSARGDLPPRGECRSTWHAAVFAALPQVETIVAVGLHAIRYHLERLHPGLARPASLTALVEGWRTLGALGRRPRLIPLPHPSWRNSAWLKRHPFFEADLLPVLREEVRRLVIEPGPSGIQGRFSGVAL